MAIPHSVNLNLRGMGASATVAINERSNALLARGRSIYKLGLGQSPFPVPAPLVQALRSNAHQKDYLPVRGLADLRAAVAEYHNRRESLEFRAEDVLVGPGSKELMFLLQLAFYGDLIIPNPSWVSYAPQAQIVGRFVRHVPTTADSGWKLTAERLAALCQQDLTRPRILILNYPNNPTGGTYTDEELAAIAGVARDNNVILLSDEIYGEIHHIGRHKSVARFYPEGTIISSGLSKWCGAGGWRLGTFLFPRSLSWLLDAMATVASETYTSTSAPIQHAAVTAYVPSDELESYLMHSRRVLKQLGGWVHSQLSSAGLACCAPEGGFYLLPDASGHRDLLGRRGISNAIELCEQLLTDTGVAVLPGTVFGRPQEEMTFRLAYVDFDGEAALRASADQSDELDDAFVSANCPRIVKAVNKLVHWLK